MNQLFTPVRIGRYTMRNRLVMSPMTRSRADDATGVPSEYTALYYAQRADAGLIITEGAFPSPLGKGYVRTPGIHADAQVQAWKAVTEAVHAKGSLIFLQLMHTGRISHSSMLPGNVVPVAPSAIQPKGTVFTASGPQALEMPRALATDEIAGVVDEFRIATRRALEAGFDGVELHAASGYLPEQFLSSETNTRTDRYGGSLENRARFIMEVINAMIVEAGSDRVGIKISPEMHFNDVSDAAPQETYSYLVQQLAPLKLAYLHLAVQAKVEFDYARLLRGLFKGAFLQGGGLTKAKAETLIGDKDADAAVFGSLYLANPDLVQRFQLGAPLNKPERETLYSAGPQGYIDYPTLDVTANRAVRIHSYGGAGVPRLELVARPIAAPGDVIVKVHAAGINALDWKIRDGLVKDAFPLALPATLGIELAGEVVELGEGVTDLAIGDRVMGPLAGLGAYSDHVAVAASKLAVIPPSMDDIQAAAIPVAALTAWQALFDAGQLQRGQTVLIHGAAGGVGSFAVQFARQAGARVVATAQGVNAGYVSGLGADLVIDYRADNFWEHSGQVDLVLDLVGGETLARSWQVVAEGGLIVSTAAPEIMGLIPHGKRGKWFQMQPDAQRLAHIAAMVADGRLLVRVSEVAGLEDINDAIERNKSGHGPGKTVVRLQ
ncbi:N-ethylmaleimide reductase [Herbaspirillum sp. Sphag1AN]|uniref:oxidoreductase n=1 Tax=unclassified Herbaspirillum TaxID=2624150 RepID=UPI00161621C7|nr:N-ethylmaleimide reductase [Herbaspirillum sp. Sphag1AN]MBB3247093.1 N-ethylmaleimide reductase [Herbaspirillum sp. Sphag64]